MEQILLGVQTRLQRQVRRVLCLRFPVLFQEALSQRKPHHHLRLLDQIMLLLLIPLHQATVTSQLRPQRNEHPHPHLP